VYRLERLFDKVVMIKFIKRSKRV